MKQMTVRLAMMLLLLSCGGRKQLSPEELSHKLDSVKNLEINEKLQLQGINLEESDNPLIKALMVQTKFTLDRSKELSQQKSDSMK